MRATFWCLVCFVSGTLAALALADNPPRSIRITENGSTDCFIYLHKNASSDLIAATQDLAEIIHEISGVNIPIQRNRSQGHEKSISIDLATSDQPDPLQDIESFEIKINSTGVHLKARTDLALVHAIYTFLQEFGGCRWYTPGKDGAFIPQKPIWDLPQTTKRHTPDFLSREFFGLNTADEKLWAKRNRLSKRFEYHHNLYKIFNNEIFIQHPEWFPSIQGTYIPPTNDERSAQPNFSNLEAADYAANIVAQYFDKNPEALSFSLGMNDGLAIDSSDETRSIIEPIHFFRGTPDYSDLIFRFMNRASKTLSESYPEKYLGCLAYHYALNTPNFPVSSKIIPYIAFDTSQWYDKDLKKQDQDLMLRWAKAGPEIIGLYNYYEGLPFVIPRIFTRYIRESLNFAYGSGIRGFTAELYPIWPIDGPKAWMTAQLLWDTQLNRRELLDEFYKNYFEKSAKPMEHFYTLCEEAWIRQDEPGWWLKFYKNPKQTAIFSPGLLNTLADLLQMALAKANRLTTEKKINDVIDAFIPTLLIKNLNINIEQLESINPQEDINIIAEHIESYYIALQQVEDIAIKNPHWKYIIKFNPVPSLLQKLQGKPDLQALYPLLSTSRQREDFVALKFTASQEAPEKNILNNPHLTPIDPYGLEIPSWNQSSWLTPSAKLQNIKDHEILIKGQKHLSLSQSLDAEPGVWYIFKLNTKGIQNPAGSTQIFIQWKDENGTALGRSSHAALPREQLEIYPLTTIAQAPRNASSADFVIQVSNQTTKDWVKISKALVSLKNLTPDT